MGECRISEKEEVDGRVGGRNCDRAVERSAAFERLDELPGFLVREPPEGEAQAGRVERGRPGALRVRIARGLHARPHVLERQPSIRAIRSSMSTAHAVTPEMS